MALTHIQVNIKAQSTWLGFSSLLPINDFAEHVLAKDTLLFRRAQLSCDVVFRPIFVLIDYCVFEVAVDLFELAAKLAQAYGDCPQTCPIFAVTLVSVVVRT